MSDAILEVLRQEVEMVCQVKPSDDSTLFDLGADSLIIVELWARLEERLGHPIEIGELLGGRDLASIAREIERAA